MNEGSGVGGVNELLSDVIRSCKLCLGERKLMRRPRVDRAALRKSIFDVCRQLETDDTGPAEELAAVLQNVRLLAQKIGVSRIAQIATEAPLVELELAEDRIGAGYT